MRYQGEGRPLVVFAGKEYGTGSSRDWAAKGVRLLGVRAAIAESFERIHRSNLIGMGVLPLELPEGVTRKTLNLDGSEKFDITGVAGGELQGQDAHPDQVGAVDALEALGDHGADAEEVGALGRPVAG